MAKGAGRSAEIQPTHGRFFRVIDEQWPMPPYPVRPSNITVSEIGTVGFFGKCEVEGAAGDLVRFFQERGRWCSFSYDELAAFYRQKGLLTRRILFGLHGVWEDNGMIWTVMKRSPYFTPPIYVIHCADYRLRVTDLFIEQCRKRPP